MKLKKAAFVAVVGRPSAGKSTLVNKLCGEKVSIVSAVPQTTRNAIRGILNREQGQLVFIDTPGLHNSEKKYNKKFREISVRALGESDIVLYVIDVSRIPGIEEAEIAAFLVPFTEKTIIAVNKFDLINNDKDNENYRRLTEFLGQNFPGFGGERFLQISAIKNAETESLLTALYDLAPEGEPFYNGEIYTDQTVDFRIAEIIREQAINRLRQELPHSMYVEIADSEFSTEKTKQKLWVRAFIIVRQESQKGIVIGKGGDMLNKIRLGALKELKKIFDWEIYLDIRVKTGRDWRHNDGILRRITEK